MRLILFILQTPDGDKIEIEFDTDIKLVRGLRATADLIGQCGGLKHAIEWSERTAREALLRGNPR